MGNKDRYYIVALSIFTLFLGGCVPMQQAKSPTFKPTIKSTDKSMLGGLQQYMAALEQQGEKGDIAAQRQLGAMFSASGNSEQADRWLRLSAESGDADAQAKLGDIYTASSQYDEALNWYTKSASQGNAKAQSQVANFYLKGWGTDINLEQSVYWDNLAAGQGIASSQNN